MATYTWEYGSEGSGLHFTIVYNTSDSTFTVKSLEGSFDLNALWWDDGSTTSDGVPTLSKSDNSLNMNGSGNEDWDGYAKLSNTGLGSEGENKTSFISKSETATFILSDFNINGTFDPANGGELGVRATSVNGSGSIKLVDETPVFTDDTPPDYVEDRSMSHIILHGEDANGDDVWLKIDDFDSSVYDLDHCIDAFSAYLATADGGAYADYDLVGIAVKKGALASVGTSPYQYYSLTEDPADPTPDATPAEFTVLPTAGMSGNVQGSALDDVITLADFEVQYGCDLIPV
jgi:hypothetical protein